MYLSGKVWSCITYIASILTQSQYDQPYNQHPIGGHVKPIGDAELSTGSHVEPVKEKEPLVTLGYPLFKPPSGRVAWDGSDFNCEYPKMPEYVFCGNETDDPGCWLRPRDPSSDLPVFNIETDYDEIAPVGKLREYEFNITDGSINADGYPFTQAKLINNQYPGPWIQACWGDRIVVKVNNKLKFNGTAMHWHGIRQHDTMHMDGVPGITQCPIAPNDYFVYDFGARQYGSAWYHSHYSVQYADGMLGPLTIHGPHSSNFDEARKPLLMTDWFHNSAYQVIHKSRPGYPTILLNGTGNINNYNYSTLEKYRELKPVKNTTIVPPQYRLHFNRTLEREGDPEDGKRPARYLLSLMNTAFDTTFVFSIDHHELEVISADFVPIKPYFTKHIHIGIGQRYNVIVEAKPIAYNSSNPSYKGEEHNSFWIRTTAAPCFLRDDKMASLQGYDETGVLTYKSVFDDNPWEPLKPTTKRWPETPASPSCHDEDSRNLVPVHEWTIGNAANDKLGSDNDTLAEIRGERFDVVGNFMFNADPNWKPDYNKDFPVAVFSLERSKHMHSFEPMQIDYDDPIFLHLGDSESKVKDWPVKWAVVQENYSKGSWIWLAIAGRHNTTDARKHPSRTGGAHPMHLHGHDFAILQQAYDKPLNLANWNPKIDNPPRRDVVLLPENGFVVIAFKVDNPGSWIMHCHIAFHASEGLALQIMESQKAAHALWPFDGKAIPEAKRVCNKWKEWQGICTNHYPGWDAQNKCYPACNNQFPSLACPNLFQDDSGV